MYIIQFVHTTRSVDFCGLDLWWKSLYFHLNPWGNQQMILQRIYYGMQVNQNMQILLCEFSNAHAKTFKLSVPPEEQGLLIYKTCRYF